MVDLWFIATSLIFTEADLVFLLPRFSTLRDLISLDVHHFETLCSDSQHLQVNKTRACSTLTTHNLFVSLELCKSPWFEWRNDCLLLNIGIHGFYSNQSEVV